MTTFGAKSLGPSFEWTWEEGGELKSRTYHARSSMTFEEILDYNARKTMVTGLSLSGMRRLKQALLDAGADDAKTVRDAINSAAEESAEREREQWDELCSMTAMMVVEGERTDLVDQLKRSTPTEVNELAAWLENRVINRVPEEVAAIAGVDPTLPTPPVESSSTDDSGPASVSAE